MTARDAMVLPWSIVPTQTQTGAKLSAWAKKSPTVSDEAFPSLRYSGGLFFRHFGLSLDVLKVDHAATIAHLAAFAAVVGADHGVWMFPITVIECELML